MGYDFPAGKYVDENALLCKEEVASGLKTSVKDGYMNISGLENQVYKLMEEKDKYYVSKAVMNAAIKSLDASGLKTSVKDGYMNISGLENQVYKLMEEKDKYYVSKAVMNAAIKSLDKALRFVCDKYNIEDVVFVGGVASSKYISEKLSKKLQRNNINSFFTDGAYSSDNACGCAIIGLDNFVDKYYVSKAVMNAAIKSLDKALRFVCDKYNIEDVVFVGGVASSKYISEKLSKKLQRNNINSFFTDGAYSSDNACGCAIIGLDNFVI